MSARRPGNVKHVDDVTHHAANMYDCLEHLGYEVKIVMSCIIRYRWYEVKIVKKLAVRHQESNTANLAWAARA